MSQDTNVENLIINKLTKAQYENIANPDPTQLYFVTDEGESISTLDDVSLNNIANGQILKYNATTQKWENAEAAAAAVWGNITGTLSDQTDLQTALDAKQNTISDLPTIRSGASLGATALQPNDNISDLTDDTATYPIDKAESVVDNNSGSLTFWSGTKAQYDAIVTKDANTLYNVEDTTSPIISILDSLYPVGSIYIGTMSACPLQTLGIGTWQLVATDRVLQGAGTRGSVGDTLNESLPNITGNVSSPKQLNANYNLSTANGAFSSGGQYGGSNSILLPSATTSSYQALVNFNAHNSNATYQNNAPVQQDAYLVNIWERIS